MQLAGESDRFVGQIGAVQTRSSGGGVGFVEDEVDDLEYRRQAGVDEIGLGSDEWRPVVASRPG